MSDTIMAKNINHPAHSEPLDREKYTIIKEAILKVLPKNDTGLTAREFTVKVEAKLKKEKVPTALFPKKGSVGWYCKVVQLDLEARKLIKRLPKISPLKFVRFK